MNKKSFLIIAVFSLLVVFFFPKGAGTHGEVTLDEAHTCDCLGIEHTNKVSGAYIYNTYCFGIPHGCEGFVECKEGEPCWLREHGCRCPGRSNWAPTEFPCEDDEECVCTHDECDLGMIGG